MDLGSHLFLMQNLLQEVYRLCAAPDIQNDRVGRNVINVDYFFLLRVSALLLSRKSKGSWRY